jgi:signal transduction histidine kinase
MIKKLTQRKMHDFTYPLRFPGEIEARFQKDYFFRTLRFTQTAMVLGMILYTAFAVLDRLATPISWPIIWAIRVIVDAVFIITLIVSRWPTFQKAYKTILSVAILVGGYGIIAMIYVTQEAELGFHLYYAGLMLIIIWTYSVSGLLFVRATILTWVIVVGYMIVAILDQHLLDKLEFVPYFVNNLYFFISANIIGMISAYLLEMFARRDFARRDEIAQAKQVAEHALEKALVADRLKSQFLATMSHELRTPMNSILSVNEMLLVNTFGPLTSEQEEYLKLSFESGKHLLSLINDVLDTAKFEAGIVNLFLEDEINITDEVNVVAETTRQLIKDKPVTLITDIAADLPRLTCDRRRIRQILLNLASNAAKFTETGQITIRARPDDCSLNITISDTGPGIRAAERESIFEPFVQTEIGIQHGGGTGLGPPISKRLVEAHGGRIWVESALSGSGSIFCITLPLINQLEAPKSEAAPC